MIAILCGLVIGVAIGNFIAGARTAWALPDLPTATRWDLVGWDLLRLIAAGALVTFLLTDRTGPLLIALIVDVSLFFALPKIRARVIVEGLASVGKTPADLTDRKD